VTVTAGIDLGSTYAKVVVLKDGKRVGYAVLPTGHDHDATSKEGLDIALKEAGLVESDVDYMVSTGYGRNITSLSDESISEISSNAWGTRRIAEEHGIRTIVDIGGQDTKVISLDENLNVSDFRMNDKCAAGTGRFLEVLAKVLNVPLDEMGPTALKSKKRVNITVTCLVFAKSEVASLITQGEAKEDIIAGIHRAIAKRLATMARKVGVRREVFFDGGPARNTGMRAALEEELGVSLVVPEMPQIVTATGAAMIALQRLKEGAISRREKAKGTEAT
jgi:predicted CoA-substrate-specific enzyme activase